MSYKINIKVDGLYCCYCMNRVVNRILSLKKIEKIKVNMIEQRISIISKYKILKKEVTENLKGSHCTIKSYSIKRIN